MQNVGDLGTLYIKITRQARKEATLVLKTLQRAEQRRQPIVYATAVVAVLQTREGRRVCRQGLCEVMDWHAIEGDGRRGKSRGLRLEEKGGQGAQGSCSGVGS